MFRRYEKLNKISQKKEEEKTFRFEQKKIMIRAKKS